MYIKIWMECRNKYLHINALRQNQIHSKIAGGKLKSTREADYFLLN